jgi:hypothetical protein
MLPTPDEILWLVVFPAMLAAVAMVATRSWRRGRDLPGWASAVAIAGGFLVAYVGFYDTPRFPPITAETWFVYLAAAVIVVAIVQAFVRSRWVGIALSGLVLLATPWFLLHKLPSLDRQQLWTWSIGAGVAMVAWWIAMELLARRSRAGWLPMLLALVVGVSGLAVINAHSRQLGMLTGGVAIPLFVVALAAAWAGEASLPRGGMLAVAVLLLGLLLAGRFLADLAIRDVLLLAIAPLAAWAAEAPGLGRRDSWTRTIVRVVAVLAVLALPAFETVKGLQETLREQTESYQY